MERIAAGGGTPLVVAVSYPGGPRVLGVIHLKDTVKPGMTERFRQLRDMGIRTVMITGLAAHTTWYDITLGLVMLIGRFGPIVLALALAGSPAGARVHARTGATGERIAG